MIYKAPVSERIRAHFAETHSTTRRPR